MTHLLGCILAVSLASESPATLEDLVHKVGESVVAINVDREPEPDLDFSFLPPRLRKLAGQDEDLRAYFKRPPGPASGVLIDADGHVLTTLYNVGGKIKKIGVILPGGKEVAARVLSRDPVDDLALIKIEEGLPREPAAPAIQWGAAEHFSAGRYVVAMGRSPDPTHATATLGIISAPSRNGGRVLQTDASLNYGNVGGPLFDLDGRLLGIAAYIGHVFPQWGQNSGIGFGVRADLIQSLLPAMKRGEDIQPPETALLGVNSPAGRERPNQSGIRVDRVAPGSAAQLAGVKAGDVILEFEQTPLEDFSHLKRMVLTKRPGDEVTLKIRRNDGTLDIKVKLGKRSQQN